jgi:hypothetical protein
MKKMLIAAGITAAALGVSAGSASAQRGACLDGWTEIAASSDSALFVDRNGDGTVCYKAVPGKGNGNVGNNGAFFLTNVVAVDNFLFPGG